MLYLKAITEVREARRQLAEGNIALRSKAISKAYEVISELDASLNMEAGDLSKRLRALYGYCLVRLLDANMHQQDEPLAEVLGLLSTLSEGWQAIAGRSKVRTGAGERSRISLGGVGGNRGRDQCGGAFVDFVRPCSINLLNPNPPLELNACASCSSAIPMAELAVWSSPVPNQPSSSPWAVLRIWVINSDSNC